MTKKTAVKWNRHTLVWLTDKGRRYAMEHIHTPAWDKHETATWKKELVYHPLIPGIICRQPSKADCFEHNLRPGYFLAGFSHWQTENGLRLRVAAELPEAEVCRFCTPFDLCMPEKRERLCNAYPILEAVFSAADSYKIEPGLFGSTALEWVTGFPYRRRNSDIDLYIRQMPGGDLEGFGRTLALLEERHLVRLDAEAELAGGYGVKLKELLLPSATILGKGLYHVKLLSKTSASPL